MKRMRIQTALKTQSQKELADQLGISQSYINRLAKNRDCWLIYDDNEILLHAEITQKKRIPLSER